METKLEKRIELLISREIYSNQTLLVQELLMKHHPDLIEEIENYYDESSEAIEEYLGYCTNIEKEVWQELDVFERQDLAEKNGFEPTPHEIYEWWLVSSWLAEKLSQFGQPIFETPYGTWWGRTCTGQAIKLDHVMMEIIICTDYSLYGSLKE